MLFVWKCEWIDSVHNTRLWWLTIWNEIHSWSSLSRKRDVSFCKGKIPDCVESWSGVCICTCYFAFKVRVIDVHKFTHTFRIEWTSLLFVRFDGKPSRSFYFISSNTKVAVCWTHIYIFIFQTFPTLRTEFTQFSLHIRKVNPLCCSCVYFEWWLTLNKQCDNFYWHLQSNVTSVWYQSPLRSLAWELAKCLKTKNLATSKKYSKHTVDDSKSTESPKYFMHIDIISQRENHQTWMR